MLGVGGRVSEISGRKEHDDTTLGGQPGRWRMMLRGSMETLCQEATKLVQHLFSWLIRRDVIGYGCSMQSYIFRLLSGSFVH